MSWSVGENDYPITMSLEQIRKEEYESHYANRGAMDPILSEIKVLSKTKICEDYLTAQDYVSNRLGHGDSAMIQYYAPKDCSNKKCKAYEDKVRGEIAKLTEYSKKHSVLLQKAKLVACKKCESKLVKSYLRSGEFGSTFLPFFDANSGLSISVKVERCPVCGEVLQNETVIAEIQKRKTKINAIRDEYWAYRKTMPQEVRWYVYSQMYVG